MYAKVINGQVVQYPYTLQQLRADRPNVSFAGRPNDDFLFTLGAVRVHPVAKPPDSSAYEVVEGTPAFINGVLTQVWDVQALPAGDAAARLEAHREMARRALRARRREAESAGVQLGQRTIPTDPEMRAQLRELRDWSQANPGAQVPVELANGRIVRVSYAQLNAAISAVSAHMRECLEVEADKLDEIDALADDAAIDAWLAANLEAGWPG